MAFTTNTTILSYSSDSGTTYTKLVDIINYPDLGGTPNKIDTTTLTNAEIKTNMLGLQEGSDLSFECLFDPDAYILIKGLDGTYPLQLAFSDSAGGFEWEGQMQVYMAGGTIDEVRKMMLTLSAETEIEYDATITPPVA